MEKSVYDLNLYPENPGVYLMKNQEGQIIYIGKAKNIKARLKQYFSHLDNRAMIPYLLSHLSSIETLICFSEKEALILENTLIKKHKPKYNALLKDDKSFIALMIDIKAPWPKLELIRTKERLKIDAPYFGPYPSAHSARTAYKVLSEHFGLRQCSDYEFKVRQRPCLLYEIKKCLAPCKNLCTKEAYSQATRGAINFLNGKTTGLIETYRKEIEKASEALEFEKAGALYHTLQLLEKLTLFKSSLVHKKGSDADIFSLYQEGSRGVLLKLLFRDDKISGQEVIHFDKTLDEGSELLTGLLMQHYETSIPAPELICPILPDSFEALKEILKEQTGTCVSFMVPLKGDKKKWLDLAYENAKLKFSQVEDTEALLVELQAKASLAHYPDIIECYDLSHFAGSNPSAVKIRMEQGRILKTGKRLYKIRQAKGGDDYGGLKEVLTRSLKASKISDTLPDLLLIDGAKGQVNIAAGVLKELDIIACEVLGLVKEDSRHDKGLSHEQLILANQKEPIILDKKSPLLFFLQNIRDEAHRAAIAFNKAQNKSRLIRSELDEIPGIGPAKKKALLTYFKSLQKIKEASLEELIKAPGIGQKDAEKILTFFTKS